MSRARSDVYRLQPSFPRKRESSGLVPGFITEATLTFAPLASARALLRPLLALLRCVNLIRRCQVLVGERRQRRRHAGEGRDLSPEWTPVSTGVTRRMVMSSGTEMSRGSEAEPRWR